MRVLLTIAVLIAILFLAVGCNTQQASTATVDKQMVTTTTTQPVEASNETPTVERWVGNYPVEMTQAQADSFDSAVEKKNRQAALADPQPLPDGEVKFDDSK